METVQQAMRNLVLTRSVFLNKKAGGTVESNNLGAEINKMLDQYVTQARIEQLLSEANAATDPEVRKEKILAFFDAATERTSVLNALQEGLTSEELAEISTWTVTGTNDDGETNFYVDAAELYVINKITMYSEDYPNDKVVIYSCAGHITH